MAKENNQKEFGLKPIEEILNQDFGGNVDTMALMLEGIALKAEEFTDEMCELRDKYPKRMPLDLMQKIDNWTAEVRQFLHLSDDWHHHWLDPKKSQRESHWAAYRAKVLLYSSTLMAYGKELLAITLDSTGECR